MADSVGARPAAASDAESLDGASGATAPELGVQIGVALSGGGVRAALFSLGVLIGLVQCGENRKVTQISSVSGGSIVNAAVAQADKQFTEYSSVTDFEIVSKRLGAALCKQGAFVFGRNAMLESARFVLPRFGAFVVALAGLAVGFAGDISLSDFGGVPWVWIFVGLFLIGGAGLFIARGSLQEALYGVTLAGVLNSNKRRKLKDLPGSQTTHVLIATDLVSGDPVYFSKDFVCCPAFGWGDPGTFHTSGAVYASAAFPGAFPVRRVRRGRFNFDGGNIPPPYPRYLKLVDGGVHNNLGTDWFTELENRHGKLWTRGGEPADDALEPVGRRLIVNAGAGSRGLHRVLPFLALFRTMSVLYDNTVRPRLDAIRQQSKGNAAVVIDIRESPYHLALRHLNRASKELSGQERKDRIKRASRWVEALGGGDDDDAMWTDFARQTAGTPTKLTKAGLESGARMMQHGYLSTLVVMDVIYGLQSPATLPASYFLEVAGRPTNLHERHQADTAGEADTQVAATSASGGLTDMPQVVVPSSPSGQDT